VNQVMPGPSATWATHTSNGAEVGGVAEGGTKGDISPAISISQVKPQKLAGVFSFSWEVMADTSEMGQAQIASWLPIELQRSLVNARSLAIWGASTAGSNPLGGSYPVSYTFNGLLNTSGTLTRSVGTDTPLDALSKAYADIRVGAAFCEPDLVAMHPNTLAALRRSKSADGIYILDLIAGPSNLTAFGDPGTLPPQPTPTATAS
jgi:HK97 family phage major capsid protein